MVMSRSFWLAVAAYLVPSTLMSYVWHMIAFHEQYERSGMYRDAGAFAFSLNAVLLQAVTLACLYPRVFRAGRDGWLTGARDFALISGLLSWALTTLPMAAVYPFRSIRSLIGLESAFTPVQILIVSPLIALAWHELA